MSPDAVLNQIAEGSPLAFLMVAAAGLMIAIAPSSLPLVSVVTGYTAGQGAGTQETDGVRRGWRTGLALAFGFVLGLATVDAAIGGLFGLIGFGVIAALAGYRVAINLFIAAILLVMALTLLRVVRIRLPVLQPELRPAASFGGAYALGIPFGLSTCPACTPMLMPIMGAAAATGTPWLGAALLFTFGLARGVPLVLVGTFTGMAGTLQRAGLWLPRIEKAGGVLLLLSAIYFLYQGGVYAGYFPPVPYIEPG